MTEDVAFLGLGVMGGPMAGHLAAEGIGSLSTIGRRPGARAWVSEHGGAVAATPAEAARAARFVFSCVGDDDDLRAVTVGRDGAFSAMRSGAVFVDHTTTSAGVAREVAERARSGGFDFLDAPGRGRRARRAAGRPSPSWWAAVPGRSRARCPF